jgi:hypothetical protein
MEKITWELPLKTVSEANSSEHWTVSSRRHRHQQFFIRALFHALKHEILLPCVVTMTRLNFRDLDDDNLVSSMKWIRDEISECIFPEKRKSYMTDDDIIVKKGRIYFRKGRLKSIKGRADSDPRITWKYDQEKSKTLGIRIEIESSKLGE